MHDSIGNCRAQQRRIRAQARGSDAYAFFNVLTGPELFDKVESVLPDHREHRFPPTETLPMFLAQALSANRSCQKAVDEAAIKRLAAGLKPCSTHTRVLSCASSLTGGDGHDAGRLRRTTCDDTRSRDLALAGAARYVWLMARR